MARQSDELIKWALFTVLASVGVIVLFAVIHDLDRGAGMHPTHWVGHGELLVLTLTLSAAALGDLLLATVKPKDKGFAMLLGFFEVMLMCGVAYWFADLVTTFGAPKKAHVPSAGAVTLVSTILFFLSLVVDSQCLRLAGAVAPAAAQEPTTVTAVAGEGA